MKYRIYQRYASKGLYAQINREGWDSPDPRVWAYAALGTLSASQGVPEICKTISLGASFDLYQHNWIVEAEDENDVFNITNGMGDQGKVLWKSGHQASGSVGDVIISGDSTSGYICLNCGWAPMTTKQIRYFETRVSTFMPTLSPALA